MPQSREGATLVKYKRLAVLFGGFGHEFFNSMFCYDLVKYCWKEIIPSSSKFIINEIPRPRQNHVALAFLNEMFIYGGCYK